MRQIRLQAFHSSGLVSVLFQLIQIKKIPHTVSQNTEVKIILASLAVWAHIALYLHGCLCVHRWNRVFFCRMQTCRHSSHAPYLFVEFQKLFFSLFYFPFFIFVDWSFPSLLSPPPINAAMSCIFESSPPLCLSFSLDCVLCCGGACCLSSLV